jgi:hypothetical protein
MAEGITPELVAKWVAEGRIYMIAPSPPFVQVDYLTGFDPQTIGVIGAELTVEDLRRAWYGNERKPINLEDDAAWRDRNLSWDVPQ